MLIKQTKAKEGYVWIRQGFWLFKQNPFTFLMLVFLYIFVMQLSMFIPILGLLVMMVLTPAFSVGFMAACQSVIRKERVTPAIYLVALRNLGPTVRKNILKLGGLYTLLLFILSLVAMQFVDYEKIIPIILESKTSNTSVVKELYLAIIVSCVLYLPIAMMMWFAPLLVSWQNMTVFKALFGSWMACWLNRGAFIVYASIWAILLVALPLFIGAAFEFLGYAQYASYLVTPFSMGAITILYCSYFATWKACLEEN